ncbi:MAG TPA: cysteine--tRNA ligase, partial [Caulobacteraceae bacterium]
GVRAAFNEGDRFRAGYLRDALVEAASLLGFLQQDPQIWFQGRADALLRAKIEALLEQRAEARKAKDWSMADRIRDELEALGVIVMDGPEGATWRLKEPV